MSLNPLGSRRAPSAWETAAKKLRLIISVGLLGWLAWRTEWGRIGEAISQLRLELWAAAVGVYLAAQIVSSFRWQLLARPLGFREPLRSFTGFYFIGMYFNLLLPTSVGGDVVRGWCLDGRTGRRMAAFLSVLLDRMSGMFVLVLVACAGMIFCEAPIPDWVRGCVWVMAGLVMGGIAVAPFVSRRLSKPPLLRRLAEAVRYYWRHPRVLVWTTLLSGVIQLANVVLVWFVGRAIDVEIPFTYYLVFVPLVTLLTLLPLSLNGMGIREGSTVLLLRPLGVGEGEALCLAILWFLVLTAVSLFGGIIYFFGWYPRPEVQPSYEAIGSDTHQGRAGQSAAAA
jgi:uncharacterized membrane protein YbhN (UPF0104 family)